jgi:hypothetical protein
MKSLTRRNIELAQQVDALRFRCEELARMTVEAGELHLADESDIFRLMSLLVKAELDQDELTREVARLREMVRRPNQYSDFKHEPFRERRDHERF